MDIMYFSEDNTVRDCARGLEELRDCRLEELFTVYITFILLPSTRDEKYPGRVVLL